MFVPKKATSLSELLRTSESDGKKKKIEVSDLTEGKVLTIETTNSLYDVFPEKNKLYIRGGVFANQSHEIICEGTIGTDEYSETFIPETITNGSIFYGILRERRHLLPFNTSDIVKAEIVAVEDLADYHSRYHARKAAERRNAEFRQQICLRRRN